jgi:CheY-like chemotaxis protein
MSRVLIIDDEPGIRFALRRCFERDQWSVLQAADGHAALERLREIGTTDETRVDVVLTDLQLRRTRERVGDARAWTADAMCSGDAARGGGGYHGQSGWKR